MKIILGDPYGYSIQVNIYVVDDARTDVNRVAYIGENGALGFKEYARGDAVPATLVLDYRDAEAIFPALTQALSDRGYRSDNDAKLQGTLNSTREHLADLRRLLNLETTGPQRVEVVRS